jgi:capsular exopolysaccharide synthesis family protein
MTNSRGLTASPTLAEYVGVVRRRKWILIPVVVLVPLVAVLLSMRGAQMYEASAQVLLKGQDLSGSLGGVQSTYVDPARQAQTEAELARVPEVARRALAEVPGSGLTTLEMLKSSSASPNAGSDLLTLTVKHPDARTAERLATAYAEAFAGYRADLDTREIAETHEGVQNRIEELENAGLKGSPLYKDLVEKERQLAAFLVLHTPSTLVVQEAERATKIPSTVVRNGMLGLVLGILLGLALVFLVEALDNRVRSVDEVRDLLGLRVLGRIPPPGRNLQRNDLALVADPLSPQADAYRMLRAGLEVANEKVGARTILIASATDGEGKSTTVANLAVALARADYQVVLADFDLRKPRLHDLFGLQRSPGVVDVELGDVELGTALQGVPVYGDAAAASNHGRSRPSGSLRVMTAGQALDDPDRVGAERAFDHFVEELGDSADIVLVDSAPLLPVGDTLALSAKVDALVLLVQKDALHSSTLSDVEEVLESVSVPKLGMVLTGVKTPETYGHYPYAPAQRVDPQHANGSGPSSQSSGATTAADDRPSWHAEAARQEE